MKSRTVKTVIFSVPFALGALAGSVLTGLAAGTIGSSVFRDVPSGAYYDRAVGMLYERGIVKGNPDGTFRPGAAVTRADLAVMLERLINDLEGRGNPVDPVSSSSPAPEPSSSSESQEPVSSASRSSRLSSSSSSRSSSSRAASAGPQGALGFSKAVFNIGEGSKTFEGVVIRTGGTDGSVSVKYRLEPAGATVAEDYTDKRETLSFAAGETTKKFSIIVNDDRVGELNEQFRIVLESPTGGAVLGAISQTTVIILDNDGGCSTCSSASSSSSSSTGTAGGSTSSAGVAGALGFSTTAYNVMENGGSLTVTVTRTGSSQGAASVNYATANGTGQSGSDYTSVSGTLNFASGETSKTFSVPVINDNASEGYRTFTVNLALPTGGATLRSPSSVTVTIIDDEVVGTGSGTFKLDKGSYSVQENGGAAVITVQRVGGTLGPVSISYNSFSKTATSGDDFTAVTGTLTFQAHEGAKTFEIPILKDNVPDTGETVGISIYGPSNGAVLGSPQEATLTISE